MSTQEIVDAIGHAICNAKRHDREAVEVGDDTVVGVATAFADAIGRAMVDAYERGLIEDYYEAGELREDLGAVVAGD